MQRRALHADLALGTERRSELMALDMSTIKKDVTLNQIGTKYHATVKLTTLSGNSGTGKFSIGCSFGPERAIAGAMDLAKKALGNR